MIKLDLTCYRTFYQKPYSRLVKPTQKRPFFHARTDMEKYVSNALILGGVSFKK